MDYLILLISIVVSFYCVVDAGHSQNTAEKLNTAKFIPINGTRNFQLDVQDDHPEKPWIVQGRSYELQPQCVRKGRCEPLRNSSVCFGSRLPYDHTSIHLTDYNSQEEIIERLLNYEALKYVPKCWQIIQPLLCAVFRPKCETINNEDYVFLPSLEMCKLAVEQCTLLLNTSFFPEFLKCNETLFPKNCKNAVREMKFIQKGECLDPLVQADSSASYYQNIEGCGLRCKDPLYTDDEHLQINNLNKWGATLGFLCHLFFIITFIIDWKNANKYPAVITFYINLCYLFICTGFLAQFMAREDIVCRKDGTLRHSEPTAGQNLSCIFNFFLIYYFTIAAMVWYVILTYAWHLKAGGKNQDQIEKKGSYFHLFAWSAPLILTITTMALSEIDGNSIVGICFVGYLNHPFRIYLLMVPLAFVIVGSGTFVVLGTRQLLKLKNYANDEKSTKVMSNIIVRMDLRSLFIWGLISVAILCHLNDSQNVFLWAENLREYIICKISSSYSEEQAVCKMNHRPSVAILQLELLCFYGSGLVMFSWCWTSSSIGAWKRYIRRKFGKEPEEVKMAKHKVIAKTWAKRKELEEEGRMSINFHDTHTDPVGLNFDVHYLNSAATNDISSTWACHLTKFIKRRPAIPDLAYEDTNASSCSRQNSQSGIMCIQQVSIEATSRRNSVDSQVSVKLTQTKVARQRRSKHSKSRGGFNKGRRESSTSVESYVKYNMSKKIKRRSGNAGLNPEIINQFMGQNSNALLMQRMNGMTTSEDDTSMTNVQIQDSRLDIVYNMDYGTDYDDHDHFNNSDDGPQIDEVHSADEIDVLRPNDAHERRHRNKSLHSDSDSVSDCFSTVSHGKLQSRNSKNSCDVAIQADPHEIRYSFEKDDLKKALQSRKRTKSDKENDNYVNEETEMNQLLPKRKESSVIITKASDFEKLRKLLLPP